MFPLEMTTRLRQILEGRILDDIQWPGRRPADLAPLCGRLVLSVRLLTGRLQRVQVQLEWPQFPDEPHGFLFRVDAVRGVRQVSYGSATVLHIEMEGGVASFMHLPVCGRLAYEAQVAELNEAEAEAIRWAAQANGRRLPQAALAELLGVNVGKARELSVVWTRSGLLESVGGRGLSRMVSDKALALAGVG